MSKKPTVAVVYQFFPRYREGVIRSLISSKEYEYLFVGDPRGLPSSGIELCEIPDGCLLKTRNMLIGGSLLLQSQVIGLALRRDIKAIIFLGNAYYITTWVAAAIARLTGKKVLFWTHGWTSPDRGFKKSFRMAFYRLAHKLLLYGHHAKRIGIQEGFRPENLHVIYNSLDYDAQVAIRQSVRNEELAMTRVSLFGAEAKNPMLICIGRLIPVRRLDLLLEAVALLRQKGCPVNLLLVGDGPESAALKARAQSDGLPVRFYGACYDENVLARLVMASDMLVMPGRIGLAAMHSLAYGTPIIIHDDPDDQFPESEAIIPGFSGATFAKNDMHSLASAIQEWLKNAPPREQLRQQCYKMIDLFYNPASQVSRIERALSGAPADDSDWNEFCKVRNHSVL